MEGIVGVTYYFHVKCKTLARTYEKSGIKIQATQQIEVPQFEDSTPRLEALKEAK